MDLYTKATLAARSRVVLKYLFDGDPASNTLSWRWVGGIQTKGKHYIAQNWNIEKFTNGKYSNVELNANLQNV